MRKSAFWRIIGLGALLAAIALFLLIPSTRPRTAARKTIYGALTLTLLALLIATCWEMLA